MGIVCKKVKQKGYISSLIKRHWERVDVGQVFAVPEFNGGLTMTMNSLSMSSLPEKVFDLTKTFLLIS